MEGKIVWFCGNFTFIARSLSLFCTKLSFSTSFRFRQSSTFLVFYVFMFKALCSLIHFFLRCSTFPKKETHTVEGRAGGFISVVLQSKSISSWRAVLAIRNVAKLLLFLQVPMETGFTCFFLSSLGLVLVVGSMQTSGKLKKKSEKAKKCEG